MDNTDKLLPIKVWTLSLLVFFILLFCVRVVAPVLWENYNPSTKQEVEVMGMLLFTVIVATETSRFPSTPFWKSVLRTAIVASATIMVMIILRHYMG